MAPLMSPGVTARISSSSESLSISATLSSSPIQKPRTAVRMSFTASDTRCARRRPSRNSGVSPRRMSCTRGSGMACPLPSGYAERARPVAHRAHDVLGSIDAQCQRRSPADIWRQLRVVLSVVHGEDINRSGAQGWAEQRTAGVQRRRIEGTQQSIRAGVRRQEEVVLREQPGVRVETPAELEPREIRDVVQVVVEVDLASVHAWRVRGGALEKIVVQRHADLGRIDARSLSRADLDRPVIVVELIPGDGDQVRAVADVQGAGVDLELSPQKHGLPRIRVETGVEAVVVDPDVRRTADGDTGVARTPGAPVGSVPAREAVERVLEVQVADDDVVHAVQRELGAADERGVVDADDGGVRADLQLHARGLVLLRRPSSVFQWTAGLSAGAPDGRIEGLDVSIQREPGRDVLIAGDRSTVGIRLGVNVAIDIDDLGLVTVLQRGHDPTPLPAGVDARSVGGRSSAGTALERR